MNNVYDAYYEIILDKQKKLCNDLILEGKSPSKEIYKFKFSVLSGAEGLSPAGKKALDAIKNVIETSDNGKLYDLINLKIENYLAEIEKSFGNVDDDSYDDIDDDSKKNEDAPESNDDELAEDAPEKEENKGNDDELAEDAPKSKKDDDDDDELAE